jgi:acyl-CoA thioester hydrolase
MREVAEKAPEFNRVSMRVRTSQTDVNGAMYHGAYFDCFEAARVDTFRRIGYTYERTKEEGFIPVVRHAECDYLMAAFMDDLLEVVVHVPLMTAAKFHVHYDVYRDGDLLAQGRAVFVFLDDAGRPIRIPRSLRECVEAHSAVLNPPRPTTSFDSEVPGR